MNSIVIILLVVAAVVVLWYIATYNTFRRMKVAITEAWSGIDVQLKRKANIIPNLVDTLKMQIDFEKGTLTELTAARAGLTSGSPEERMKANERVNSLLPSINAVVENYPQLGTNQSFLRLMGDIRDCEDKIAYSRTRYNMTVASYNAKLQTIPSNFVASSMGLTQEPMFEITETARQDADNMRISDLAKQ